jgi:hypothetical protein
MRLLRFAADSLTEVTWRQTEETSAAQGNSASGEQPTSPLATCLTADFSGFLGNLPDKAQELIQELYAPQPDLAYDYHYERSAELSEKTWQFWCYLADDQVLTLCSGKKTTQRTASAGQAKWKVTCYRAAIA